MARFREALSLEHLTRGVVVVAVVLLVVSFFLNVSILRTAGSGTSAAKEVRDGTRVSSCRVLWADDVEQARSEFLIASGDIQILIAQGLEAVAVGDDARLGRVVDRLGAARDRMGVRKVEFRVALAARLEANGLALSDQDEFLALCAERQQ